MKKILFFTTFLFFAGNLKSQNVNWVKQGSDAGSGMALGVSSDGSGNLYVAGMVTPPTLFDTISLSPLGGPDAYIAKYNNSGSIQWALAFGGSGSDYATDISTDLVGNSFVTGW